ncbi:MAG: exosortase/archaeosortase family protein [Verrucomicrobia bacterium]|nr:exosortase/archaeosortase family protein [Verrucomicrobiota bacterium]
MIESLPKRLQGILPFVVVGALWCLLVAHLSVHWATNAEYSFGWFGPVLCAYLFLMRWVSRPAVEAAHSVRAKVLFCLAGFALLPTWLFEQPNPDWRLVSWLLALEVITLTICTIYFLGGRAWARHFAFSVCLILATVPWPGDMEDMITQRLMQVATAVTVAGLNLFGVQAMQHGNLIEVKTGLLGVEAACSGIRSLQATLLVSLFLGELYRARWRRRAGLVLCGMLTAFACNIGRTFLLSWVAAACGTDAISKWHDPAGFAILAICFVIVWGFAHLLSGTPSSSLQWFPRSRPNPLPGKLIAGLAAWLLFMLLATEIWYRAHEGADTGRWSVEWPASMAHFEEIAIPAQEAEALGFDEGSAASWTNGDATRWTGFFFRWTAGPVRSRIQARLHRPEKCLPAAGYRLQADRGTITVKAKSLTIPFHALDFEYNGEPVHVFFCLWEDHLKSVALPKLRLDWTRSAKFESVLRGERNLGQQMLELVIFGNTTADQAESALRLQIENLIRI